MRALLVVVILIFTALAVSYWLPLEGPGLDPFLSGYFSDKFHLALSVHGAKIRHWDTIYFQSLEMEITPGISKLRSGRGFVKLKDFPFPVKNREQAVLQLERLTVPADLCKKTPLSFLTRVNSFGSAWVVDRLRLSISRAEQGIGYHLVECASKEFNLRGGLTVTHAKVSSAHALLLLRSPFFQKLPDSLGSRLISRRDDWRGLRVLYSRHTLTAIGQKGPFFKAYWQ